MFLVRHGETDSNVSRVYAGRSPEPLNERGRAQVERLAESLRDAGVDRIWTSTVRRARETSEILSDRLGVPISGDERLDEMLLGPWEGMAEADVTVTFPRSHAIWSSRPSGCCGGGGPVDAVSREIQVPAHELEEWRRDFLGGALAKLKSRSSDSAERALKQAQAKIGELTRLKRSHGR